MVAKLAVFLPASITNRFFLTGRIAAGMRVRLDCQRGRNIACEVVSAFLVAHIVGAGGNFGAAIRAVLPTGDSIGGGVILHGLDLGVGA